MSRFLPPFLVVAVTSSLGQSSPSREGSLLKELFIPSVIGDPPIGRWLSRHPPVLEVDNFLPREVCTRLIADAKASGLRPSSTPHEGLLRRVGSPVVKHYLSLADEDGSGCLNHTELSVALGSFGSVTADAALLDELHSKFGACVLLDDFASPRFADAVEAAKTTRPWLRTRHSDQAWLTHEEGSASDVFLRELGQLLGLKLQQYAESLQIAHYSMRGRYNCHHDSGTRFSVQGRMAGASFRVLTAMVYLNDVHSGGETAFPYLGTSVNARDVHDFPIFGCTGEVARQAVSACNSTGLVVKPSLGKLLLFFNGAAVQQPTGSLPWQVRDVYPDMFHAACPVVEGEKWVAQQWISLDPVNLSSSFYFSLADAGDSDAQVFLGKSLLHGSRELMRDVSKGKAMLRRAAASGVSEAIELVGNEEL